MMNTNEKVYIVFNASDEMVCVCKTKELAKEICENKDGFYYNTSDIKIDHTCPHFRNDGGWAWCKKNLWVISNKDNTDCERKCKERYEI